MDVADARWKRGRPVVPPLCAALLIAVLTLAGSAASVLAQAGAGEVTGLVRDPAGAAVPGAAITVTSVETNRQRAITTAADGLFAATGLQPGEYRIDVELAGFKRIRRSGIHLATGEKIR